VCDHATRYRHRKRFSAHRTGGGMSV
jgi:hypothetical protein